jgi:hypothetical protein
MAITMLRAVSRCCHDPLAAGSSARIVMQKRP